MSRSYLLLLIREFVPSLVHFQVDSVLLQDRARLKAGFEIRPDNGTRSLRIQESGSERLLGRIRVLFLLFALALLVLAIGRRALSDLVGGTDDLVDAIGSRSRRLHSRIGRRRYIGG